MRRLADNPNSEMLFIFAAKPRVQTEIKFVHVQLVSKNLAIVWSTNGPISCESQIWISTNLEEEKNFRKQVKRPQQKLGLKTKSHCLLVISLKFLLVTEINA